MEQQAEKGEKKSRKKLVIIPAAVLIVVIVCVAVFAVLSSKDKYRLIKINSFEGNVKVEREEDKTSDEMDAFEGMQLLSEDVVKVNEGAFLELLADDDKHIGAEENTGFVLHATGSSKSGNITIELLYGKALFTIDNKLNDDSSFEVTTPNATLSVRGTKFSVEYDPEKEITSVEVFNGKVRVNYENRVDNLEQGDTMIIGTDDTLPEEPPISGENEDTQSDECLFIVGRTYNDVDNFADSEITLTLSIESEHFNETNRYGVYDPANTNDNAVNLNDTYAHAIERDYLQPHEEEIAQFYEEDCSGALLAFQYEREPNTVDVTEWFPETMTLKGVNGNYVCHITHVDMMLVQGHYPLYNEAGEQNPPFNWSYVEEDHYVYVSGASFMAYGYIE
ncbi:MAG: FecR domain-containing protein [Lachnospiraceae bacterium]